MKKLKKVVGGTPNPKRVYQKILKHYGIEKDFRKLFRYKHEYWPCFHYLKEYCIPSCLVNLAPEVSNHPDFKGFISDLIEELMKTPAVRSPGACELSIYNYFTVAVFLGKCLQRLPKVYGPDLPEFAKRLVKAGCDIVDFEVSKTNVIALIELVYDKLSEYNDIQNRIYWCDFSSSSGNFEINIIKVAPEKKHVVIDGQRREITQCLHIDSATERVLPLKFKVFDSIDKEQKEVPVYFQMHAARQFLQRVMGDPKQAKLKTRANTIFLDTLVRAVETSEYISKSDGTYLVKATFHGLHFGYFLLSLVDGCCVVRTFLFLTMDGTPEGDKLWAQLRLSRSDKSYLGLDKLQTYFYSDIIENQELREILIQCGCRSVFDIAEDFRTTIGSFESRDVTSTATTVKEYLRPVLDRRNTF